jgi:hypothetical protein
MLNRAPSYSFRAHHNPSQATLRATNILAFASLFFGTGCALLIPSSFEQRLGSLFLFGLVPAMCFHGGGFVLSLALHATSELGEMLAIWCFRCAVRLLNVLSTRLMPFLSGTSAHFWAVTAGLGSSKAKNDLSQMAPLSINHFYRRADLALHEFSCRMIRSVARFLIRIQSSWHSQTSR